MAGKEAPEGSKEEGNSVMSCPSGRDIGVAWGSGPRGVSGRPAVGSAIGDLNCSETLHGVICRSTALLLILILHFILFRR